MFVSCKHLEEVEQMFRIYGRDGKISMLRLGILAGLLGVVFVIIGLVTFFIDRSSHQVPLDIAAYPGAQSAGVQPRAATIRSVYYIIADSTADDVANYYQQKLDEHYGNSATDPNREQCQRFPPDFDPGIESDTDFFPEFLDGTPDVPPYRYICLFDRSGLYISQFTKVTIEPGIASNDQEGMVVVEYEQTWQS
jgi:hypothetical protein